MSSPAPAPGAVSGGRVTQPAPNPSLVGPTENWASVPAPGGPVNTGPMPITDPNSQFNTIPRPGNLNTGPGFPVPTVPPYTGPQPAQPVPVRNDPVRQPGPYSEINNPSGPSVWDQSNAAYEAALRGTRDVMRNYDPMNVNAASYNPALADYRGYNAADAQSQGYDAALAEALGFSARDVGQMQGYDPALMNQGSIGQLTADQVRAGQIASTDLNPYMNPFTQNVTDRTLSTIDRQRQMALNDLGAKAQSAGAFGGSRQALAEGTTNAEFGRAAGDMAANLNLQNFQNAQGMAGQDIASRMQAALANQGANLQAGQFNIGNQMQVGARNQDAQNQAGQFLAAAQNQGLLSNQQYQNMAAQFGAEAANQMAQFNANNRNQASQFGASAANQAALSNQAARNAASQYGADAFNQSQQFNANNMNQQRSQYAQNTMQAQLANQQAREAAANMRLGAAGQMAGLSQQGFDYGRTLSNDQYAQGLAQQELQQRIMNSGQDMFNQQTSQGDVALQRLLAALGGSKYPESQTSTSSRSPGILDLLTAFL
jgi:hypothetical protein